MAELTRILDGAVRRERARIVAALLRVCGSLDAAEDALHEAVLAAMRTWHEALPTNPGAWLMRAAMNAARDGRRHQSVAQAKAHLMAHEEPAFNESMDALGDDHLRLIFTCCHPALSRDNQIALTLKTIAGFSTEEIGRAFLCSEETISQRILRAKQLLRKHGVPYAIPEHGESAARVTSALGVVYAMFNEGHTAREGTLMRLDLQHEALRLGRLLGDFLPREPEVFGLLAMMAFGAGRARTRTDATGLPILLADQDRAQWDRVLLREGLMALQYARSLSARGPYVLQAELAAVHVTAPAWNETNWNAIVALYDELAAVEPSPIVALNRAVALSMKEGPLRGLAALKAVEGALADYHLFYAIRSELLERAGEDGRSDLKKALSLVTNEAERRLLERRLEDRGD